MLNLVTAENSQGGLLTLSFTDASSGIIVADIEGLGPVKATLVSSSRARMDGQQYHSSQREARNLKFTFDLNPDYVTESVADLRKRLYAYFMPKTSVMFGFYQSDGPPVNIQGYVESCEPSIFSKEPAIEVSIMCFEPDFINYDVVEILGNTTATTAEEVLDYQGSVETWITFTLNVNRSVDEFTIYHRIPDGSLRQLDFSAPLVAGDTVLIVTTPGSKEVTLVRGGVSSSLLYAMSPYSSWIELQPGENSIRVYAEGAAIPFSIHYLERYGGL